MINTEEKKHVLTVLTERQNTVCDKLKDQLNRPNGIKCFMNNM